MLPVTGPGRDFQSRKGAVDAALFAALVALLLVPVWAFPYFPSQDGPSHLFNSHVFLAYSQVPAFQQAFSPQIPPAGNLTGHALAIFLLKIGVPAADCEKILASICIAGLAAAFYYALTGVTTAPRANALLILPFLYNWPLQMGFWSFSLGVPLVLVCAGLCLRYAGRWDAKHTWQLLLAAAAVYACHPISWAASALVTGLIVLAHDAPRLAAGPSRRRAVMQIALPMAVFVPFIVPNLLFAAHNENLRWDHISSLRERFWPVYNMTALQLFEGDVWPVKILFLVLMAVSAANLLLRVRGRRIGWIDTLLASAAVFIVMGMWSPARVGEGTYLQVRLFLFAYLLWMLWLAATVPARAAGISLAALAVGFTGWLMAARLPYWQMFNRDLVQFVKATEQVAAGSTICQLDFSEPSRFVYPMEHAVDLLAAKNVVDVRDYEAGRKAFWTHFRPGYFLDENYLAPSSLRDFEGALERFEARTGKRLDYIVLTDMKATPGDSLRRELPVRWTDYELAEVSQPPSIAAVFVRKAHSRE